MASCTGITSAMREHFLAHLVNGASRSAGLLPTYPGLWLQSHPPPGCHPAPGETSWSCHHGVSRWTGDCACTPGDPLWKIHLRAALDKLAEAIDQQFVEFTARFISDPWDLRNRYIHVLLGQITRRRAHRRSCRQATGGRDARLKIHLLLEAQHARQRMYTSCGWFFDDFDRIEPQNNLASAAQAVRLVRAATGVHLEGVALPDLSQVTSARTGLQGRRCIPLPPAPRCAGRLVGG